MSFSSQILLALNNRKSLIVRLHDENTNCYRLFHGAVEGVPGLTIDRYGGFILIQTWRDPLALDNVRQIETLINNFLSDSLTAVWNHRTSRGKVDFDLFPVEIPDFAMGKENGLLYDVRPRHLGIDPLLFLDFRSARRWVLENAKNKSVLNLFSYTCGIGVSAGCGQAKEVLNVDFAKRSLSIGRSNAQMNGLSKSTFKTLQQDFFPVVRQLSGLGIRGRAKRRSFVTLPEQKFDLVVLDPPRYAKSPFGLVDTVSDYQSLFKPSWLCVAPAGQMIATNNVASVSWEEWSALLQRCAMKANRPIADIERLHPEADFPSPDGKWPLKIALCSMAG